MNAEYEIAEFRRCAAEYIADPCAGTRYALEMAAAACSIAGVDPSTIEPGDHQKGAGDGE